ncbi:MAG: glycosyltransferase [Synechococcales cyanobacterium M58_A2018_015]|nr:glycosyltransferase [Synechococcales cyanobacterium M58_A2018_015]
MIQANTVSFSDCEAVCLEPETVAESGPLLQARLSAKTKIVFCGNIANDLAYQPLQFSNSAWDENYSEPGIGIYSHPPASWVDPFEEQRPVDEYLLWPWNRQALKLPPTLPSGTLWPKISVVTVSYNQGAYLEETIRSVILQGYPNLEYIIIDGGSTDNTLEILQRYDSYLSYWVSEPDEGQSNALNKGFGKATGDILTWLNSDDCYLPETLLRVAIAFDRYATDMVAGGCELRIGYNPVPFKVHHTALPVGQAMHLPLERLLDIDQCWQAGEFFYQPEVFWTRELWQRAGGYVREDLFYSMDYELWLRMANHNARIVHIPDPLARYRVHHEQKTYGDEIPYLPELKQVSCQFQHNSQRNGEEV